MCKQERTSSRRFLSGFMACTLWIAWLSAGAAKDLAALAEAVTPAYTAMSIGLFCNQFDGRFLSQTSGPRGTAVHYAEHVKDEAISSLTFVEASAVLRAAAESAREMARGKVRELTVPGNEQATTKALTAWCDADGRAFVKLVIERHDSGHEPLLDVLKRAKQ